MDTVTVTLDCTGKCGILSFSHNDIHLGMALDDIDTTRQWCFLVGLFRVGAEVQLEKYELESNTDSIIKFK